MIPNLDRTFPVNHRYFSELAHKSTHIAATILRLAEAPLSCQRSVENWRPAVFYQEAPVTSPVS